MKKNVIKGGIALIFLILSLTFTSSLFGFGNEDETPFGFDEEVTQTITQVGGNLTHFINLTDTPASYSGEGGNCVKVNVGETGIEFDTCSASANSSNYWDDLNTTNTTHFENNEGVLTIVHSWLTSFIDSWFGTKDTDDLTEGSTNLYDNQSWNENLADTLYLTLFQDNWYNDSNGWINWDGDSPEFNQSKLAVTYYNATQSEAVVGTIDGGTLVQTQHLDGNYDAITFNFSEEAGSPALDLRINFTNVSAFNQGVIRYRTSNLAGSYPLIQLWNFVDEVWEDYPPLAESIPFATITQPVFDDTEHLENEVVSMRLYKESTGNINNHYYVDWLAVLEGFGTPSGEEIDPYSYHTDEDINATGYNIYAENLSVQYIKLNCIGANDCDLTINGSICCNDTGTYQVG